MAKTKIQNPELPAADVFDQPPGAEQWRALAEALASGDAQTARAILAANQLPVGLAKPLSKIRPEAERLQAIVAADVLQSQIDAAMVERGMIQQSHPKTVEDAQEIGKTLAALIVEIASMEARHSAAANARSELAGLQNIFAELFTGAPGAKMSGGLTAAIWNALSENGFEPQRLCRQPWTQAYRLQFDTSTTPRRRLRAVGGPNR